MSRSALPKKDLMSSGTNDHIGHRCRVGCRGQSTSREEILRYGAPWLHDGPPSVGSPILGHIPDRVGHLYRYDS